MAVKEGGRWRGERQAKQQSKVREREGKNIREAATTTDEEEETQTDNREAQVELWTSRSGNAADRKTNRIGRLRGTGVGGRMAFFFCDRSFLFNKEPRSDRGLCWMRVAVVSCFPHPRSPLLTDNTTLFQDDKSLFFTPLITSKTLSF